MASKGGKKMVFGKWVTPGASKAKGGKSGKSGGKSSCK